MGHAAADLMGKVFGRLTVVARVGSDRHGNAKWKCRCECGNYTEPIASSLKSGGATSCGCLHREIVKASLKEYRTSHGMTNTPTYRTWCSMKNRCLNKRGQDYSNYAGRGIKVCERWMVFENFLADMGERPEGTSLDRIDNDGNYEPGNCRWATRGQQNTNTRSTIYIEGHALRDLAERFGMNYYTMYSMYKRTPERAIEFVKSKLQQEDVCTYHASRWNC